MTSTPPKRYQEVKDQFPEIIEAYEKLGKATYDGPIPPKFVHLIKLSAAATMRSEGAVHSHARRAIEHGATKEEVRHAVVLLTNTIAWGNERRSKTCCCPINKYNRIPKYDGRFILGG